MVNTKCNSMLSYPIENYDEHQEESCIFNDHKKITNRLFSAWPSCQFHFFNNATNKFEHNLFLSLPHYY